MKFYVPCDIEGVASLACWDEARPANACYAPMAREMTLEAAAAARGLFSGGADEVIIEDMHGDGCNIDCSLLPRDARLLRGITHDIVGLTGIFDEASLDGVRAAEEQSNVGKLIYGDTWYYAVVLPEEQGKDAW